MSKPSWKHAATSHVNQRGRFTLVFVGILCGTTLVSLFISTNRAQSSSSAAAALRSRALNLETMHDASKDRKLDILNPFAALIDQLWPGSSSMSSNPVDEIISPIVGNFPFPPGFNPASIWNAPTLTTSHTCLLPQDDLLDVASLNVNVNIDIPCQDWRPVAGLDGYFVTPAEATDLQDLFFDRTKLATLPDEEGWSWMAADVAGSVQLTEDRFLWLFGDTLIGQNVSVETWDDYGYRTPTLPRQTLAFVDMKPGEIPDASTFGNDSKAMNFFLKKDKNPVGGQTPEEAADFWYWILAGLRPSQGVKTGTGPLFLVAALLESSPSVPGGWGDVGSVMFRVENPDDSPEDWIQEEYMIPGSNGLNTSWSVTLLEDDEYVYMVGTDTVERGQYLSRVPLKDLLKDTVSFSNMEVWAELQSKEGGISLRSSPRWIFNRLYLDSHADELAANSASTSATPTYTAAAPSPYSYGLTSILPAGSGVTELSVFWEETAQKWMMVTLSFLERKVILWVADTLTGPWASTDVLDIPAYEKKSGRDHGNDGITRVYYAVKVHKELTPKGTNKPGSIELVLTYNGNTMGSWPSPEEYTPRFFRLHLENWGLSAASAAGVAGAKEYVKSSVSSAISIGHLNEN